MHTISVSKLCAAEIKFNIISIKNAIVYYSTESIYRVKVSKSDAQ